MVKRFRYTQSAYDALTAAISPERLQRYLDANAQDQKKALELYTWNTAASAAFYGPLQMLEVALRNAMHRELTADWGRPDWYDHPTIPLTPESMARVNEAKRTCRKNGNPADAPHVVAELSFGFWVALLGPGPRHIYDMQLWRPTLHRAFRPGLSRKAVHRPLDYLRTFRNRIAHHEHIFGRHLAADYQSIITVTEWICEDCAAWIDRFSRVDNILAAYPPYGRRLKF